MVCDMDLCLEAAVTSPVGCKLQSFMAAVLSLHIWLACYLLGDRHTASCKQGTKHLLDLRYVRNRFVQDPVHADTRLSRVFLHCTPPNIDLKKHIELGQIAS